MKIFHKYSKKLLWLKAFDFSSIFIDKFNATLDNLRYIIFEKIERRILFSDLIIILIRDQIFSRDFCNTDDVFNLKTSFSLEKLFKIMIRKISFDYLEF